MTFSCPDLDWDAVLSLAKRLGYSGVEPRLENKHRHGIEIATTASERQAIRDAADRTGVSIACLATSRKFVGVPSVTAQVEAGHAEIDLASDLGCKRLRVFGGDLPPETEREEAVAAVAGGLSALADHAAERGVSLCLETHDGWCNPDDVSAVMQRCNHFAVEVNWDAIHTQRAAGRSPEEAYEVLAPWIGHVHVHDGPRHGKLELWPIGTGDVDHRTILRLLHRGGYRGFLSGEWILGMMDPHFVADHLERESVTLHKLLEELV